MIDYNFQIYKIFFDFSEKTNVNFNYLCLLAKKSQQQLRNLDETMKSVWNIRQIGNEEHSAINHLSAVLGISAELSKLLVIRNVKTFDEAKAFFRPSLDNLYDPFLIRDMSAAVRRGAYHEPGRREAHIVALGLHGGDGRDLHDLRLAGDAGRGPGCLQADGLHPRRHRAHRRGRRQAPTRLQFQSGRQINGSPESSCREKRSS